MSLTVPQNVLLKEIQLNCDISDAKDHGIYSMCSMVLKLRNLYKWEQNIEPWSEPESADLLDWIEAKENYWATIADKSFSPLTGQDQNISPDNLDEVNNALGNNGLLYGAGYGRSLKAIFFVAEKLEQDFIEGCPIIILGKERAREMASPFAMVQDGIIIIRKEALRFFLWDQIQELRSSCRSAFRHALMSYGLITDGILDQQLFKSSLDTIVEEEMNLFIYHEVGEILQQTFDTATFQTIISRFPSSILEFVCRAIKDILADTHPRGLLAYVIREQRESSLSFYIGFLDGLRKKLFPEIFETWEFFVEKKDWQQIELARQACWEKNLQFAEKIMGLSQMFETHHDDDFQSEFNRQILLPLDLELPK